MSTKSIINTIYNYLKEREVPFSKQKEKYQDGNWTKEEHQRFIESIFIFGFDWKKMEQYIQTRTILQVRSHSQKFIYKLKKQFIKFYGEEELISNDIQTQTKHILLLLSNIFHCDFITDFISSIDMLFQQKINSITIHLMKKKENFISILLNQIKKNNTKMVPSSQLPTESTSIDPYEDTQSIDESFFKEDKDIFSLSFSEGDLQQIHDNMNEDDKRIDIFTSSLYCV